MKKKLLIACVFSLCFLPVNSQIPSSIRSKKAIEENVAGLKGEFKAKGLDWGSSIFIRIFKYSNELEVWVKKNERYELFKTYSVCYFSGGLGSKKKEGDGKSPEGFYYTKPFQLNPTSAFHLSFNIGYPNAYDRAKKYTGSAIMIHGNCVSIGCYAMTDDYIEEIFTLLVSAYEKKQPLVRIHIFPFRMKDSYLSQENVKNSEWYSFWLNLKEGYDFFEKNKVPPNVEVKNGKYVFNP